MSLSSLNVLIFAAALLFLASTRSCLGTYLSVCSVDADCSLTGEKCLSLSVMGCSKGYCMCQSGKDYDINRTACVAVVNIALGAACTGADFEVHVQYAGCYYGISTCYFGFSKSGLVCTYNIAKTCTNTTTDCGPNTALGCTGGTCQCLASYVKSSSTGLCILKDAGQSCTSDSDCWPLSPNAGVGYSCTNGACGCSTNYKLVQITDIDINEADSTMKATSASYCFSSTMNSTFNVGLGGSCLIWPYSQAANQVSACDVQYGCYVCPEDSANTFGFGTCRKVTSTSTSISSNSSASTATKSGAVSSILHLKKPEFLRDAIYYWTIAVFAAGLLD